MISRVQLRSGATGGNVFAVNGGLGASVQRRSGLVVGEMEGGGRMVVGSSRSRCSACVALHDQSSTAEIGGSWERYPLSREDLGLRFALV
jgi:hypothetical protein